MDTFNLQRFVAAQDGIWQTALAEIRNGQKRSHWMWFIFPQVAGLGQSSTARFYAISGREEAEAYLAHPQLAQRLLTATRAMLLHTHLNAHQILGSPDDLKFHSSMTLFAVISKKGSPFEQALHQFYGGKPDEKSLARLLP